MNKKVVIGLVVLVSGLAGMVFAMGERPPQKTIANPKVVYVENLDNGFKVWVADNNDFRSNKKLIYYEKKSKEIVDSGDANLFVLMGAHLKGRILYYADLNRKVISSYDVVNNKRKDTISGALYPFCVDDAGSIFVYYTGENNKGEQSYRLFNVENEYSKEFSFDCGWSERPLKTFDLKYILFDTTKYFTDAPIYYLLYDLENRKIVFEEADQVAIYGGIAACLGGFLERENDYYIKRNGLIVVNMNADKVLRQIKYDDLFPSDGVDIRYLTFSKDGKRVEMWGNLLKKKGKNKYESTGKPVIASYDYTKDKLKFYDRSKDIPANEHEMNFTKIIGVYDKK